MPKIVAALLVAACLVTSAVSSGGFAAADPLTGVVAVKVYGSQIYGVTSQPSFFGIQSISGMPAGVSVDQYPTCTGLTNGHMIPSDVTLDAGNYVIDPATCSGVTFKGPGSEGLTPTYLGSAYTVVKRFPPTPVATATGTLTSLRTGTVTYTAKYTIQDGLPGTGIAVVFGLADRAREQCSAMTDSQGVARCTVPRRTVTVAGTWYYVWTVASTNYFPSYLTPRFKFPFN
jgi:hypothetical protein